MISDGGSKRGSGGGVASVEMVNSVLRCVADACPGGGGVVEGTEGVGVTVISMDVLPGVFSFRP